MVSAFAWNHTSTVLHIAEKAGLFSKLMSHANTNPLNKEVATNFFLDVGHYASFKELSGTIKMSMLSTEFCELLMRIPMSRRHDDVTAAMLIWLAEDFLITS